MDLHQFSTWSEDDPPVDLRKTHEPDRGFVDLENQLEAGSEVLRAAQSAFAQPGLEGVEFLSAWLEGGNAIEAISNSSGLSIKQSQTSYHLALAVRTRGETAGSTTPAENPGRGAGWAGGLQARDRTGYLGWSARSLGELSPERLVPELAWRLAATKGGGASPGGQTGVVLDCVLASRLLLELGPRFVKGPEALRELESGTVIADPHVTIEDRWIPGADPAFDGEGTPRKTVKLVENGRRVGLLADRTLAGRYGGESTGSSRRLSYRDQPSCAPGRLVLGWKGTETGTAELLNSLAPGLFMTSGRFLRSDSGDRGVIAGGGIWVDRGQALLAVTQTVFPITMGSLLLHIKGAASPRGGSLVRELGMEGVHSPRGSMVEGASSGSILLEGRVS